MPSVDGSRAEPHETAARARIKVLERFTGPLGPKEWTELLTMLRNWRLEDLADGIRVGGRCTDEIDAEGEAAAALADRRPNR